MDPEQKKKRSNIVLVNDTTPQALYKQIQRALKKEGETFE